MAKRKLKPKVKAIEKIHRRYLLLFGKDVSKDKIEKVILDYLGILGWAKAKPVWVSHVEDVVLAVERKSVNSVRSAFEICKEDIQVSKVSGTLKGLEK
jgi:RNase P/RNase MRP subunit POP5